jgi:hypothetical protein
MNKGKKIIYWVATLWLGLGMTATGIVQLMQAKEGTGAGEDMAHLGYPDYLMTILGVWKLLGVAAILIPRFPILKEWAYAGFFFVTTGAIFSHVAVGQPFTSTLPALLLLALTLLSWYMRPENRKPVLANFSK